MATIYTDSTALFIYDAVTASGTEGMRRGQLVDLQKGIKNPKSIDSALYRLVNDRCITRHPVYSMFYVVNAECRIPLIHGRETWSICSVLADFPAGISNTLLAEELQISRAMLVRLANQARADGAIRRIDIHRAHGGGFGWALPEVTNA